MAKGSVQLKGGTRLRQLVMLHTREAGRRRIWRHPTLADERVAESKSVQMLMERRAHQGPYFEREQKAQSVLSRSAKWVQEF
jgi:hypothetical protein